MASQRKELIKVEMKDGRHVLFQGQKAFNIHTRTRADGRIEANIDCRNGESRNFICSAALLYPFAMFGIEQKVMSYSARDAAKSLKSLDRSLENWNKNQWSGDRREAEGGSMLAKAVAEFSREPLEEIEDRLKYATPQVKMKLRNTPEIAAILLRMGRGEKGRVDTLLEELKSRSEHISLSPPTDGKKKK